MMNAIEVRDLKKQFQNFLLDGISFDVPSGYVCGFIGQNGAGKTTTIKLMLGMAIKDSGEIQILGKPSEDVAIKESLGVLFDSTFYMPHWTPLDIESSLRPFYGSWNSAKYHGYLDRFGLSPRQKVKTLSRGMKMQLGIAVILSYDTKLLLLDEPTSGLDPVIRDQMLDLFKEYVMDENRSIFFSSHITGDIEKVADYIVYIHRGKIFFSGPKDELMEKYCVIRGGKDDLKQDSIGQIIGIRQHLGGFEGLIKVSDIGGFGQGVVMEKASLDDIMVHINREGV